MKSAGQIVLFRFPQTNSVPGKLRPALLLGQLPGPYDDWVICMISTQLDHYLKDFDEIIDLNDPDFNRSGLKSASVVRTGRLAVVEGSYLMGAIGEIDPNRLKRVRTHLANWLTNL